MSSKPLDDSASATEQPENRNQNGNAHPQCGNCGAAVTREYHRVLSDNEGVLRSCLHCTSKGTSRGDHQ